MEREERKRRVEALLRQGKPYDALMEAEDDWELGSLAYRALSGGDVRERVREMERRGTATPQSYVLLADDAMRGDEAGTRLPYVRELLAKGGLSPPQIRKRIEIGGRFFVTQYRQTRRMRYFESAMKYFGAAGAPGAAVVLAREAVSRFQREGGWMYLNDALEGLQDDLRLPPPIIARDVPVLARWTPIHASLKTTGWFDATFEGKWGGRMAPGDAQYDAFLQSVTGRSFANDLAQVATAVHRARGRPLKIAEGVVRTWGVVVATKALSEYEG